MAYGHEKGAHSVDGQSEYVLHIGVVLEPKRKLVARLGLFGPTWLIVKYTSRCHAPSSTLSQVKLV